MIFEISVVTLISELRSLEIDTTSYGQILVTTLYIFRLF